MQMITSLNRIYDVLDEEPVITDSEDSREFPIQGAFTFENGSFGYHTYEPLTAGKAGEIVEEPFLGNE